MAFPPSLAGAALPGSAGLGLSPAGIGQYGAMAHAVPKRPAKMSAADSLTLIVVGSAAGVQE